MRNDRHGRDPGILEIIQFYDQPERAAWHLLTDREAKVLYDELRKCADPTTGFPYICKNYFWITTKDGSDILLKFKETQEMVWETIRYLRMRGRGVKLLIIKARQLYISSFCEAYLAYETMINPNNRGLLVSYDETHAAKLFQMILHIYDQLPWWLRPMIGTRKYEEGIHLINRDPEMRRLEPGMNSRITVQGATQNVGVAEGETINTSHLSEFGSWSADKARKVIMGDFRWALPDSPGTTAILETRVQRASRFAERLWESMVDLGDDADWHPLFIPIYFDKSHFMPPRTGWKPDKPEVAVKERAAEEWRACTNCGQVRPASFGGGDLTGVPCRDCKVGSYQPYVLQDGQMRWLEFTRKNAEGMGENAVVEMQQSLATNPQQAFANVTETIFSKAARDWVAQTTRGECLARGFMSSDGVFHAPRRIRSEDPKAWGKESEQCWAQGCKQDHSGETDRYLKIWQPPIKGVKYWLSADVAAGYGGSNDYSYVNISRMDALPNPDIQVAAYRCNTISSWHFADLINALGKWYNNALVVVDYTNHQTTGDRLLNFFHYPNIYRWFNPDTLQQAMNRCHWVWNGKNKEDGWAVLDGWLRDRSYIVKDPVLAKELRHYQRLEDGTLGAPDSKDDDGLGSAFERIHDDSVSATVQGIIAAHQRDPRRRNDAVGVPQQDGLRGPGEWKGTCLKCERFWEAHAPQERERCPFCGSIWLKWKLEKDRMVLGFKFEDMQGTPGVAQDRTGKSEDFSFGFSEGGFQDGKGF